MPLVVAGHNDTSLLGEGWYGPERAPEGIVFRAMMPRATLRMAVPGVCRLTLLLSCRAQDTDEPLRIVVGEDDSTPVELTTNLWTTRAICVAVPDSGMVTLVTQNPWSPDRIYRNGDARSLGALVAAFRLE